MRKSVLVSVAILALVFGFYLLTGLGCKQNTDPAPADKGEGKEDKVKLEASKELADASKKGKDYLVSMYGKKFDEGGWGKINVGFDTFALLGLMSDPNPIKPTEKPIAEMIDFLISKQSDKGSWSSEYKGQPVYETSLVLLTFKRALTLDPEHPKKKELADAIKKAVDYLILAQVDENPIDENDVVVKKDADAFNLAHYGGWGYGFNRPTKAPANLSTSHFAMDALYESGYKDDPKVKEAFKKAIKFLEYCQNSGEKIVEIPVGIDESKEVKKIKYANDGGGIYGPGIAKPGIVEKDGYMVPKSYGSMTYVLMKEYVFAGLDKTDKRIQAAFNWLKKAENFNFAINPGFDDKAKTAGLYYQLYAASKALGVMGEETIKDSKGEEHQWRAEMQKQIIDIQQENGSWVNENPKWFENSPVLATGYALCAIGNTLK